MEFHHNICLGTGEIGRPLYELINGVFDTLPIDPIHFPDNELTSCSVLHVCIPGDIEDFERVIFETIVEVEPECVVIHSTVTPGTTSKIQALVRAVPIIHAPVHGKHHGNQMKKDMLRYPKYLGVPENFREDEVVELKEYFEMIGFGDVRIVHGPEHTEWLKVLATTYFGLQVAWAQEVERVCDEFNLDYDSVTDFFSIQEDIRPPHYSGQIGGHCVMPNIKIIESIYDSLACNFIKTSNDLKRKRDES